jgi:putative membrane protein
MINLKILSMKNTGSIVYKHIAMMLATVGLTVSAYSQEISATNSVKFLQTAATTGMNTVALGNLGEKRLQNQDVKNYAFEFLNDQIAANVKLKALAKRKKIKLPDPMTTPINSMQTRIDTAVQDTAAAITDSLKTDFDSEYLKTAIDDHQKAITLFEQGSKVQDANISSFARRYLPILRKHLREAQRLSSAWSPKK